VKWTAEAIWEAAVPLLPDFTVEILPTVDSTNSELMRRARAGQRKHHVALGNLDVRVGVGVVRADHPALAVEQAAFERQFEELAEIHLEALERGLRRINVGLDNRRALFAHDRFNRSVQILVEHPAREILPRSEIPLDARVEVQQLRVLEIRIADEEPIVSASKYC